MAPLFKAKMGDDFPRSGRETYRLSGGVGDDQVGTGAKDSSLMLNFL